MPSGNESNHVINGLTVVGGLALQGQAGGLSSSFQADSKGSILLNGLPVQMGSVVGTGILGWNFTSVGVSTANQARATRCIVPATGFLRDIGVFVAVQSGNLDIGVYDTGQTTAGTRTKLYSSGSTAVAASGWQTVDPGAGVLPVTQGQHIDIAWAPDNGTASIMRYAAGSGTSYSLPTGYFPECPTALPKLGWLCATSFPLPASFTEANCAVTANNPPCVIFRVSPV